MSGLILPRRSFLTGLASLIAAPGIVKAESLMPVRSIGRFAQPLPYELGSTFRFAGQTYRVTEIACSHSGIIEYGARAIGATEPVGVRWSMWR